MLVAISLRISQDRAGEGLGVARQLADCQNLADQLGWTVADVYCDNDTSATSGKPRPEYERMLADIEAGKIQAIIAWHPDRLYRRMADLERLITIVEKHDVAIRTVRYGDFDLATPTGRMVARILGSVATGEVEVKADRWKRAWQQKREAGLAPGGQRLYGYTTDGQLVEDEAATLRWLADQILAGASLNGLATQLNARGITTAVGGVWRPNRIRKLMLNPRLAGHATLKGEIVGKGNWEAVLDEATWQNVRSLLMVRDRGTTPRVALLAGLVVCGRCGQPLRSGRRSDGVRRLSCIADNGLDGCGKLAVIAEPVEQIAEGAAREYLSRPKIRRRIAEARAGGQTHILAELDAMEAKLGEIDETIDSGDLTVGEVKALGRAADRARDRVEALQAQLAATSPVPVPPDVEADWPTDLGERRRLVELVVARVVVAPAPVRGGGFDPARVDVVPTDLVVGPQRR